MGKPSVWKNRPDGRTVRRNKIAEQFAWVSIAALVSPAYRALSLSAHRLIARIQIEHAHHGGRENGKLPVTFRDFQKFGIHWNAIAPAIREAEALGFIRITQYGVASNAEFRIPNMFALTHLPTEDGQKDATDDWRRIKTFEEADAIAKAARKAPSRYGRFPKKDRPAETDLRYGKRSSLDTESVSQPANFEIRKPYHCLTTETVSLSISWGGGGGRGGGSIDGAEPRAEGWQRNSKSADERLGAEPAKQEPDAADGQGRAVAAISEGAAPVADRILPRLKAKLMSSTCLSPA